jgi:hypothetical protein
LINNVSEIKMKTLLEYIETLQQKHDVRIKLACECGDDICDKIEKHLEKYDAEKVTRPSKTILMSRPLDFPNLEMAEVYIIDFTAKLPVSPEMLKQELARLLDINEGLLVVRMANEPREQEAQHDEEGEKFLKEPKKLEAKLGTEYSKDEAPDQKATELYGDKYNTKFLKELKKLSDDRKKETKAPKVLKDPDVPATEPELGDSKATNKKSPVRTFTAPMGKGK